jgi:Zn-dependent peptidase ImmA (M78 family)/DNA-binding XRE family transcriptional regulator
MSKPRFNPARLTLARRRRGMTKVDLGYTVDLSSRWIAAYERKEAEPPPETLARLADVLRVPPEFFFQPPPVELSSDSVSFRSFARLSAGQRDAALAAASIALEFSLLVDEVLALPPVDLPDVRDLDPATAALAVRSEWALGHLPAPNIIHLVEARGCRVFSLVDDVAALDAFSLWSAGTPFIFLTQHKSPERSRWDASHELAHLLLHVGESPQGRQTEQEADVFAGELLLPTDGVRERATRNPTLADVRVEKRYWRVSALAYIRRLHQLHLLTERQYKTLVIEATKAGYRREEGDIERERSGLWPRAFAIFNEDGVSTAELARRLAIRPAEIRELTFSGLSLAS